LRKIRLVAGIEKEKRIEAEITQILRDAFSFRYIVVDRQERRMGAGGLEKALTGTLARCDVCRPSSGWLRNDSPKQALIGLTVLALWPDFRCRADLHLLRVPQTMNVPLSSERRRGTGSVPDAPTVPSDTTLGVPRARK
jgi:hypothetical protein